MPILNVKKRYVSLLRVRASGGMVLIMALWAVFFLSALALAIAAYVRPQLTLAGRIKNGVCLRVLAEAAARRVIADGSVREGGVSVKDLVGSVDDALVDEERKININTASALVLAGIFQNVAGIDKDQAQDIAAAILDWRQPGEKARINGAKSFEYQSLHPSYPCKDAPFEVLEEILLVKGINADIFKSIQDEITIYGQGRVNINTADTAVLKALGMQDSLVDKIINFRNGKTVDKSPGNAGGVFKDEADIVSILAQAQKLDQTEVNQLANLVAQDLFCTHSENFRAHLHVQIAADARSIDFVFTQKGAILFWREE